MSISISLSSPRLCHWEVTAIIPGVVDTASCVDPIGTAKAPRFVLQLYPTSPLMAYSHVISTDVSAK